MGGISQTSAKEVYGVLSDFIHGEVSRWSEDVDGVSSPLALVLPRTRHVLKLGLPYPRVGFVRYVFCIGFVRYVFCKPTLLGLS